MHVQYVLIYKGHEHDVFQSQSQGLRIIYLESLASVNEFVFRSDMALSRA